MVGPHRDEDHADAALAQTVDLFVTAPAGELLHGWWNGARWSFAA